MNYFILQSFILKFLDVFLHKPICKENCEHFLNVAATMLSCKRKLQRWASKGKIIGFFKKIAEMLFCH